MYVPLALGSSGCVSSARGYVSLSRKMHKL